MIPVPYFEPPHPLGLIFAEPGFATGLRHLSAALAQWDRRREPTSHETAVHVVRRRSAKRPVTLRGSRSRRAEVVSQAFQPGGRSNRTEPDAETPDLPNRIAETLSEIKSALKRLESREAGAVFAEPKL